MAFDSVPWVIDGGAQHSAEIARTVAYAAFGGAEGVVEAADLKVTASATPDNRVRAALGAFGILNTYPQQTHQAYAGRNPADTYITIAPTAGAARSDLIVARINDPQYGGSAQLPGGPFAYLDVISNVGSTADKVPAGTSFPAIPLARVTIPPSTGTITNAMITDLRSLIRQRSKREVFVIQPSTADIIASGTPIYSDEPAGAYPDIKIPSWATRATISYQVGGLKFTAADGKGALRIRIGTDALAVVTQDTPWDNTGSSSSSFRIAASGGGSIRIPPEYRGTAQRVALQGTNHTGVLTAQRGTLDAGSTIVVDVEFTEDPSLV